MEASWEGPVESKRRLEASLHGSVERPSGIFRRAGRAKDRPSGAYRPVAHTYVGISWAQRKYTAGIQLGPEKLHSRDSNGDESSHV